MDIGGINLGTEAVNGSGARTVSNYGGVDKNGFIKLLVAELQNQDPMNSQDNTEYIAQMAQFSALEQMENLNESFQNLSTNIKFQEASSMIGKTATIAVGDSQCITGRITGARLTDGAVKVVSGDSEYDIDDVVGLDDGGDI